MWGGERGLRGKRPGTKGGGSDRLGNSLSVLKHWSHLRFIIFFLFPTTHHPPSALSPRNASCYLSFPLPPNSTRLQSYLTNRFRSKLSSSTQDLIRNPSITDTTRSFSFPPIGTYAPGPAWPPNLPSRHRIFLIFFLSFCSPPCPTGVPRIADGLRDPICLCWDDSNSVATEH